MGLQQFDEVEPISVNALMFHGSAVTPIDLFPADNLRRRVDAILCASDDTIAHVVNLYIGVGGFVPLFVSFNVPAGAGFGGVAPSDLLSLLPASLQGGFSIPANVHIQVACAVDVTGSAGVVVFGLGGYV